MALTDQEANDFFGHSNWTRLDPDHCIENGQLEGPNVVGDNQGVGAQRTVYDIGDMNNAVGSGEITAAQNRLAAIYGCNAQEAMERAVVLVNKQTTPTN